MSVRAIMHHQARPWVTRGGGAFVEGERDETDVAGPIFRCVFFPEGTREAGRRGRILQQDQLMHVPGEATLNAEDKLELIELPGLQARYLGMYEVDGEPQQLGKPGAKPRVILVLLKRVAGGG